MMTEAFKAINQAALNQCPALLERLLPGGRVSGNEYECTNIHGGKGDSMKVNLVSGKWADFATYESGGDLVSLVAAREKVSQPEAARLLAKEIRFPLHDKLSGEINLVQKREAGRPAPITPIPDKIPKPSFRHCRLGDPAEVYQYRDKSGGLLAYICRFTLVDKDKRGKSKKEFIPLTYTDQGWRWQGLERPYPFYGLHNLSKMPLEAPVVVVEGEHKADVLKRLTGANMAVLGLYGGSGKAEHMDYEPLRGRDVYYWPDNDKPGFKAALSFAGKARRVSASVKILRPPRDVKETWDAADAIEEDGWDYARLRDWMSANRLDPDEFQKLAAEADDKAEHDKEAEKYHAIDIFDFMRLDIPQRKYLISPILQTQGIALLHAQRGIGKTFIALSLAFMVASGGKLFDRWEAPEPARVLYIDGEMPARAMQDRLTAIIAGSQSEIRERALFHLLTPDLQEAPMPNIATPEGQKILEPFIAKADFIVIDNLATLTAYGRSNEEESWRPMQEWLLSLRRQGKTSLVIHHEGKNGLQRGTSAKEDAVDMVIALRRPKDYLPEDGARFEVHYTKCRHVSGKEAMPFEAKLLSENGRDLVWTTRSIEDVELNQYRELRDSGYSIRDAGEEMGITRGKAQWLEQKLKLIKSV